MRSLLLALVDSRAAVLNELMSLSLSQPLDGFCADIYGPQRLKPTDFDDPLTFLFLCHLMLVAFNEVL